MSMGSGRVWRRSRVAVILSSEQDAVAWRERYSRGETLDQTPYGYHLAQDEFDMRWSTARAESPFEKRVRTALAARLGFDVLHVWRNRRLIRESDVVWTHTEREHLAVAALQLLTPAHRRVAVLAQSVWLWDIWPTWGRAHRWLVARLLRTHSIEAVHSRVNRAVSETAVPGRRVVLVPFGTASPFSVATDSESREASPTKVVLAVGNDADRDWRTLAAVAAMMPDTRFRVASSSRHARQVDWPVNVLREPAASRAELRALYRDADAVVVPLRENQHASGATACIEAMWSGRPLVVTAVGGIDDYVRGAATLVERGNPDAMKAALESATTSESGAPDRAGVDDRGLTQRDYVNRYVSITRSLLGQQEWDQSVSAFAPVRRSSDSAD